MVWLEPFILLALIGLNGALALSEIAIVSVNTARLSNRAASGDRRAKTALALAKDPTRFLSTVQVGISLVGIIAGAFGGATLAERVTPLLERIVFIEPYADAIALGFVVLVITYLTLVFGELVPKRLALSNPERWACSLAGIMRTLSRVTQPIVQLLSFSTNTMLRVLGVPLEAHQSITEDDIRLMMAQGTHDGVFNKKEREMIERVFSLDERRIATIMTPYPDIVWLDLDDPLEECLGRIIETQYSSYPIRSSSLDKVDGMLNTKKLFAQLAHGGQLNLQEATNPPLLIPEGTRALQALELFRTSPTNTGLVVNEYGAIQGIVTLSDFMLALVGMIDSDVEPEQLITEREDGSYLIDGILPIEELKTVFDDYEPEPEAERAYHTLGGFMMQALGRIPKAGDLVRLDGIRFEVVDMDNRRVDKVLVERDNETTPPTNHEKIE